MFAQKTVELGTVAVGDAGSIGHVAIGEFQQLHQIVALETLLGIGVRQGVHDR